MASNTEVTFTGNESLEEIFKVLPDKILKKVLLNTFIKASKPLVASMKGKVPVRAGGKEKGGNLKKSIGTISGKNVNYPTLYVGPRFGKKFKNDGWYGKFLIKGTGTRTTKKSKANRGAIVSNPFVEDAFSETSAESEKIIEAEMANETTKILQKYAVK